MENTFRRIETEREWAEALPDADPEYSDVETGLASWLRQMFDEARNHRQEEGVDNDLLSALRAMRGDYDPDMSRRISEQGGSQIWVHLTSAKCRGAAAWLLETMLQPYDRMWELSPTPVADLPPDEMRRLFMAAVEGLARDTGLPPEVLADMMVQNPDKMQQALEQDAQEEADKAASKATDVVDDVMVQGDFREAFIQFVEDFVRFPAAILKGPIMRQTHKMAWVEDGQGTFEPVTQPVIEPHYERVSPFDIYPMPHATTCQDAGLFQVHRMPRTALEEYIGAPGFREDAIRAVLREKVGEWLALDTTWERDHGEKRDTQTGGHIVEALEYHGPVPGDKLADWGLDVDPDISHQVCAWIVGRHVIKAALNPDPMYRKPYFKASWKEVPGSFWGQGIPKLIEDSQAMVNEAARAQANNMGLASGPMIEWNIDRLADGQDPTRIHPWMIIQTKSPDSRASSETANAPALRVTQINPIFGELQGVIEKYEEQADRESGVPRYVSGDASARGAAETASGLSMLMSAAARGVRSAISNIDRRVIEPAVEMTYHWVLRYRQSPGIRGDLRAVARGSNALMQREARAARLAEALVATNNPTDMAILRMQGRAELLREWTRAIGVGVEKAVPDDDEIMAMAETQAASEQPAPDLPAVWPDGANAGEVMA